MEFSKESLAELRAILRDEFKRDFTEDEAKEIGTRVLGLIRLLVRPIPGERADEGADAGK